MKTAEPPQGVPLMPRHVWPRRRSVELQALLLILENATFACPENEAHLVSPPAPAASAATWDTAPQGINDDTTVTAAERDLSPDAEQPLCAWLVERLPDMYQAVLDGRMPRECLHSALAVLMNVAHNSAAGREVVEGAGVVAAAALLMPALVAPFLRRPGAWADGRRISCEQGRVRQEVTPSAKVESTAKRQSHMMMDWIVVR